MKQFSVCPCAIVVKNLQIFDGHLKHLSNADPFCFDPTKTGRTQYCKVTIIVLSGAIMLAEQVKMAGLSCPPYQRGRRASIGRGSHHVSQTRGIPPLS